jgi:uncharacterized protein YndB with AHSA1/START domain
MQADWRKFTKRIPIKTEISKVYHAWSTQEELENWFLRKAEFTKPGNCLRAPDEEIQKGDQYLWIWYGYPDTVFEKKQILEANGKDFLQFGFTAECIVSVKLYTLEGETIVELTQDNIPPDDNPATNLHIGCGEGWTFYLANLKSYLEGGIDLRNKNEKIQGVISS